jgi:predicted nucleic-acid-binding protein
VIAIDTNVLVRFLVNDDADQFKRAKALVSENPIFVPSTVLLEAEWVLRDVYGFTKARIVEALGRFLDLDEVSSENAVAATNALAWTASGMDFADALHLASVRDCESLASFDRKFARLAGKHATLRVWEP